MKNVTEPMREQLAMLENFAEGMISDNFPPFVAKLIMNNEMYEQAMSKVTDTMIMFMDAETGEVDGAQAHEMLQSMFPSITSWISVPRRNFFISDEVNSLANDLIGRDVM